MTNKKTALHEHKSALEQLKANLRNNHKVLGAQFEILMQQAFAELAERLEALEAKAEPCSLEENQFGVDSNNAPTIHDAFCKTHNRYERMCHAESFPSSIELDEQLANEANTIELPQDTFDLLHIAFASFEKHNGISLGGPDQDGNYVVGSTTFIRAKKSGGNQ